ncbi:MAG: tryptophan synthase subunit alpha [Actinobacteria bacterium]|nr:tryptophan synthase subunit alpha [Actinomycetota bacterium]
MSEPWRRAPVPAQRQGPPDLEAALRAARAEHKLLVPYVTGGLRDDWVEILEALAGAGADALEVGLPFSDPMMDGATIQEASHLALGRGTTPASVLAQLRGLDVGVPLVVMTYANLVMRAGTKRFASELAAARVSGAIIPDLPLEESGSWEHDAASQGVQTVLLAAPVTPDERLAVLCERSRGFVYGVNLMGVTGERSNLAASSAVLAKRLKAATDKPVVMGFGISGPAQAVAAAQNADGVVVASALMRAAIDGASPEALGAQAGAIRAALNTVANGN